MRCIPIAMEYQIIYLPLLTLGASRSKPSKSFNLLLSYYVFYIGVLERLIIVHKVQATSSVKVYFLQVSVQSLTKAWPSKCFFIIV
jgi:hypothetical protein